jgi:replicative DNA helicase
MTIYPHDLLAIPDATLAQQALLGAIFIDNSVYWRVAGFLKAEHFGPEADPNRIIYEICGQMITEARPVNPITIKPYIKPDAKVGEITLWEYVVRLQSEAVGTRSVYEHGRAIIEMWARHRLIGVAQDLDDLARHMPVNMTPEKIISSVAERLTQIASDGNEQAGSSRYGALLPKAITSAAADASNTSSRIPWFLRELDQSLGGIRRGNLIGLMSDSGGGKTSFALQQCRYAASAGFTSAFFSLEVTGEEAALQAAAQRSQIELERIDSFNLDTRETARLEKELAASAEIPFHICDMNTASFADVCIRAKAMVNTNKVDLIVIDHAKLIDLPNPRDIFAERIKALYMGLKMLAKQLDVAILILIQRNDDWKQRWRTGGSIKPVVGDAYGGSSIKQALDVWFSIYRPEPLLRELIPTLPAKEHEQKVELMAQLIASQGKAWMINHKRRRGEPGQSPEVRFEAEFTQFKSATDDPAPAFEGFVA